MPEPLRFVALGTRGFCPATAPLWRSTEETVTVLFEGANLSETYTGRDRLLLLTWLAQQSQVLR